MLVGAASQRATSRATFPAADVRRRLQSEVQQAADESVVLRGGWEPVIDSLRMVSVLIALEDLFPFKIDPEKMIQRGGYTSEDEAVEDILKRSECLWNVWRNSKKPRGST